MDPNVRNIAPFINDIFTITSKWWNERVNPVTHVTEIHRGLDISTGPLGSTVYSILDGEVHSLGTSDSRGNWIIIVDKNEGSTTYGYATLYMHLAYKPLFLPGNRVSKNQEIGREGQSGQATGVHLHVELCNLSLHNWVWPNTYNKDDYLDPTVYMGIDNIEGTRWLYDGTPIPYNPIKKSRFPWYLISDKRKKIIRI